MERLFGEEVAPGAAEPEAPPGTGAVGADVPLATRMRPRTLDEIVGQEHLLAAGRRCGGRSRRATRTR